MGIAFIKLKDYRQAAESFNRSLQLKADNGDVHYWLGYIYNKLKDNPKAIEQFKQAIIYKPEFSDAIYDLSISYLNLNKKDAALEQYRRLKNLDEGMAKSLLDVIFADKILVVKNK